jgi:hypothetical protein
MTKLVLGIFAVVEVGRGGEVHSGKRDFKVSPAVFRIKN